LTAAQLCAPEVYFPLKLFVCSCCWLVQTEDYTGAEELFISDYAYFSSISQTWLAHAAGYAEMISRKLNLDSNSYVIEVASNDGYLLKHFVAAGIPCLGIEPTASTADAAERLGINVVREFFGRELGERLAAEGRQADLVIGNNVFAHVPDVNDFAEGLKVILKPDGVITLEFPHLMRLIENTQFDTVYHEHFSYLSLYTASRIFRQAGLRIWDVEELPTQGGSLRIYGCHSDASRDVTSAVSRILQEEERCGMRTISAYQNFQEKANRIKNDLLLFLIDQKHTGKKVCGYGAAAKGNTLLNYAGVRPDLLPYVCDAAPSKQGKYLPGSHIPVVSPDMMKKDKPDIVLILPWNIADEVRNEYRYIDNWGGRFVIPVPSPRFVG
jgi:SAM-dependent methyltransferase